MNTKMLFWGQISSDLIKQQLNCSAIMTAFMFGKRGGLQAFARLQEHHPNLEAQGCQYNVWNSSS